MLKCPQSLKFWREKTFKYVLRYLLTDNNESSDPTAEPSAKKRKVGEDEDDWLSDNIGAGGKKVDDQNQDEVHSYDSVPASNSDLSWWKKIMNIKTVNLHALPRNTCASQPQVSQVSASSHWLGISLTRRDAVFLQTWWICWSF